MVVALLSAALTVCALTGPRAAAQNRGSDRPANFVQWRAGLASSAQPDAMYLSRLKDLGYAIVINLAPPQSHGSIASEGAIIRGQGVQYLNIPVDFDMRGAAFVYLYRVIHEGASPQEEAAKLTGVWVPNRVWKKFIDDTLAAHGKKAEIL